MGLLGRILGSLYPQPSLEGDPADQDPANRGNQLSVTLLFGRGELRLEIGPSARPDDTERIPDAAEMIPAPCSEQCTAPRRSMPPQAPGGGAQQSRPSLHSLPQPWQMATEGSGGPDTGAASFWDALDPTEREALRSVASCRTFAAGATIMQ